MVIAIGLLGSGAGLRYLTLSSAPEFISAPGGVAVPSGDSGAQASSGRVAGADISERVALGPRAAADHRLAARSDSCRAARKAVRYYRAVIRDLRERMGASHSGEDAGTKTRPLAPCPLYLAHV